MELRELPNTGVIINTEAELKEYLQICEDGGWRWQSGKNAMARYPSFVNRIPILIACEYGMFTEDFNDAYSTLIITLQQFKERQNIMKYSEGDVLILGDGPHVHTIQGLIGLAYISIDGNGQACINSEKELDEFGYILKTDEPEKVEVSFKEAAAIVAKEKGVSVEELLIKESP